MIGKKSIQLHISQTDTQVHVSPLKQCNIGKKVMEINIQHSLIKLAITLTVACGNC